MPETDVLAAPPADLATQMDLALADGVPFTWSMPTGVGTDMAVSVYPPSRARRGWRVYWTGAKAARSTGSSTATVWMALNAAVAANAAARAERTHSWRTVGAMLDDYLETQRVDWAGTTYQCRRGDLSGLREAAEGLACRDLTKAHFAKAVNRCGSKKRGGHVRRVTLTALAWAKRHEYLTAGQLDELAEVEWPPPAGSGYKEPRNRRQLAKKSGSSRRNFDRGEVPTVAQVDDWATQMKAKYVHGEGFFHLLAATGLRIGESFALCATADPHPSHPNGEAGNFVDLDAWVINVDWQVSGVRRKHLTLPKCEKVRTVDIPHNRGDGDFAIRTSFDLRGWLTERCAQALTEAWNPRALLFPTMYGDWWDESRFSKKVVVTDTQAMGWPVSEITDAHGKVRRYQRFTPHSLRDFYAVTAVDYWQYKQAKLLRQGGWEDMATVMRYHYGADDDT